MLKLITQPEQRITHPMYLKPGELAVITKWGYSPEYIGHIIMLSPCNEDIILSIGGKNLEYWLNSHLYDEDCEICVLQPGDTLQIV
jgi:hypothetical protein